MVSEKRGRSGDITASRRERVPTRFALTDDRGCVHQVNLRELHDSPDQRVRYVSVLAWRQAGRPPQAVFIVVLMCLPFFAGLCAWLLSGTWLASALGTSVGFSIYGFSYMAIAIGMYRLWARRRFRLHEREVSTVFLANGLCPICMYPIGMGPRQADGCLVCAECGSAWNGGRVVPFEPGAPTLDDSIPEKFGIRSFGWSNRRIVDAGGRSQTLLDGDYRRALTLAHSAAHRQRLVEARRVLRRSAAARRILGYCLAGILVLFMTMFGYTALVQVWPPVNAGLVLRAVGAVIAPLSVLLVSLMVANPFGHSANKPDAVRELLKRSLCPSCGADLSLEPMTERRRCRCSRCLATWDLDRRAIASGQGGGGSPVVK